MPGWELAIPAASYAIGELTASGKNARQLAQQGKLQELQMGGNKEMMEYGMRLQKKMWEETNYNAQVEQMKKAGINPALLYGMGGGGGQSIGSPGSGGLGSASATGATGNEGSQAGSMGLAMASQIALMKAQKENIEADTQNKLTEAGYTEGAKTENTTTDTKLKGSQILKTNEEKDSLAYDNIIKDLVVNRDEKGNPVDDDKDRLAFKQQTADYLTKQLNQKNIDANTKKAIAEIAQKWQGLSLQERQVSLNEIIGKAQLGNKDQDQIINIIDMALNILTRGLVGGKKHTTTIHDNSYNPRETHIQNGY